MRTLLAIAASFSLLASGCGSVEHEYLYRAAPGIACHGDSGGPGLMTVGGVERLVGVSSRSDCTAVGTDTRVDAFLDYLRPRLKG